VIARLARVVERRYVSATLGVPKKRASNPVITLAHGPRIIRLHDEVEQQILAKRITLAGPNG
jgi:hypothetical protein